MFSVPTLGLLYSLLQSKPASSLLGSDSLKGTAFARINFGLEREFSKLYCERSPFRPCALIVQVVVKYFVSNYCRNDITSF